jgi:shikimate kinase
MTSDSPEAAGAGGSRQPAAVALVGFMGAGKSAVGRELAAALGIPFTDTDDLIVAEAGPIQTIFAERGEPGFRALEACVAEAAIRRAAARPCVLALGGGAVLSGVVREALKGLLRVVWLAAPPEELWARVTAEGAATRPLAADEASFRALLAAREPLYGEVATVVVDTGGQAPGAVAADLAALLETAGAAESARTTAGGRAG